MPPKRKTKRKPPKRSKSQSQSQRQSVIVNVGKTTPAKKKRSGRGGLPPPSYQQNLFPPTIIQQQAPNIAVLENQISRLTSMIQEPIGIKQPATPLSINTQSQQMAGQKAEERRAGPTASNFQAQPSKADFGFPESLGGGISDVSTLTTETLPVGFNEDESVQTTKPDESLQDEQAEAFKQQILKQKKEKEFGGSSLPPSNTIKQDNTGVKKSPPQSKLAEEDRSDRMVSDAMDAEELLAERQKLFSKALPKLPRKDIVEGDPNYNQDVVNRFKKKLGNTLFRQLLEQNRKELEPKVKKVSRKKASSSSSEEDLVPQRRKSRDSV